MMPSSLSLSLRYLTGHFKQYIFVLAVLSIGYSFISVASSLSDGMNQSVTDAALRHYAGHIFVVGRDGDAGSMMVMEHPELVEEVLARAEIPVERIIRRAHEFNGATVFFNGNSLRLKDVFGVNFQEEADLFEGFEYGEGRFSQNWDENSLIISEPMAKQLKVMVGDQVILRVENRRRQLDTHTFNVQAIIADASIYGYARAYVHRETLSVLMGIAPAEYSVLGILVPDMSEALRISRTIHKELSQLLPTAGRIETKAQLTSEIRKKWKGVRYFVFPLPVYISEVTDLLLAMEIGSYLLLSMIILVVLAAVVVTYRVVLHDRTREIGTMRAVGFSKLWVISVLLFEAALVLVVGIVLGLLFSFVITSLISFLSFDWIPGFEIFMREGRLTALYRPRTLAINTLIVLGATFPVILLMLSSVVSTQITRLIKGETK